MIIPVALSTTYNPLMFSLVVVGCPYAKNAASMRAGTGGPDAGTTFKGCDGNTYKRNRDGCIPDEVGKDHQRITNAPGTLSMANTGRPESGGQFKARISSSVAICHCLTRFLIGRFTF